MHAEPDRDVGREIEFPPLAYPGARSPGSGLLRGGHYYELRVPRGRPIEDLPVIGADGSATPLRDVLRLEQVAPLADRALVVAVGSNASPAVMHRKLAGTAASTVLPFVECQLRGIAVGHSAHVSRRGYIAAAPYASPSAVTHTVASFLDPEQLRALDRTEPNYRRIELAGSRFTLVLGTGAEPASYQLYESRGGVLKTDDGTIPLGSQEVLHRLLTADPRLAGLVPPGVPEQVVSALATPRIRDRVSALLQSGPYAVPSGLSADKATDAG